MDHQRNPSVLLLLNDILKDIFSLPSINLWYSEDSLLFFSTSFVAKYKEIIHLCQQWLISKVPLGKEPHPFIALQMGSLQELLTIITRLLSVKAQLQAGLVTTNQGLFQQHYERFMKGWATLKWAYATLPPMQIKKLIWGTETWLRLAYLQTAPQRKLNT